MSFLSRKNSRSDRRGSSAAGGRRADSEYDDYGYTPDGYQDDDSWSPDEYFSPEGIKGRWAAGARPGERAGGRGRRAARNGRDGGWGDDEPDAGYDDSRYDNSGSGPRPARGRAGGGAAGGPRDAYQAGTRQRAGYGQDGPYPADDYGTGGYDLAQDDSGERGSRGERGEPGGGRRRRDRGERGERGERRRRLGRRDRGDDIWPDDGVSDEDYWASVAADRPFKSANGLDDDPPQAAVGRPVAQPPGAARPAGEPRMLGADRGARAGRPSAGDPRITGEPRVAGEQRTGSGRLGPPPGLRPAAGSAAGQGGHLAGAATRGTHGRPSQSGLPQPGFTPGPAQHSPAQPSFQPNGTRTAARQADRADLADRTERIERVTSAGYRDPRPGGRSQDGRARHGRGNDQWNQDARSYDARGYDSGSYPVRGSGSGSSDLPGYDSWNYDSREHNSGSYASQPRGRPRQSGADDDPLTSKAYSRSALIDTDGRSYRVAHRTQAPADRRQAALSEEAHTFSMTTGSYQASPQLAAGRYPGSGGQQSGQYPYDRGTTGSYPYAGSQPASSRPAPDEDRYRQARQAGPGYGGYPGRR